MCAVVVDTHTIIWYLSADCRISANAAAVLDSVTAAGEHILVPSICLAEVRTASGLMLYWQHGN